MSSFIVLIFSLIFSKLQTSTISTFKRFEMEDILLFDRHQKYRNPIPILYNIYIEVSMIRRGWKWWLNPEGGGGVPPARMISTKPLSPILDPPWRQFIVLVVFANRLEMPRDCRIIGLRAGEFATRRDRVEPVHPIIRRLPLIIYNLSRFNVSPMLWSIFATRLTRFVLWINRMGKYIYGQTDVIWKVFDIWRGKKQCCFLINFYVWGKRESFSCLLNYCLASYPLNFPCLIRDGGTFFVEIVIIVWWYLNEEAFSIL